MGAESLLNNNSNFDADRANYDRQNRLNSPDFAPGQGDNSLFTSSFETPVANDFDVFSNNPNQLAQVGVSGSVTGTNGVAGGDVFGAFNVSDLQQPAQQAAQQQREEKSVEDKFWDVLIIFFKGLKSGMFDLMNSTKEVTPKFISAFGRNVSIVSSAVSIIGLLFICLKLPLGLSLLIGGIISLAVGVLFLMFFVVKGSEYDSQYKEDNTEQGEQENINFSSLETEGGVDFSNDFVDSVSQSSTEFSDEFSDEYTDEDDTCYDDDLDDFDFSQDIPVAVPAMDADTALSTVEDVPAGVYTRKFLYENFNKVLPNLNSDFTRVITYSEDSDVFLSWDDIVREAGEISGLSDDSLPYLISLEASLFTIKVTINRAPKMKEDVIAREIANTYAHSEYPDSQENRSKVFYIVEPIRLTLEITIFTGVTHLVSLKDMYARKEDYILDSNIEMPVVLGIDENGNVICADFKKVESLIVSGQPRSGKSWEVQAILAQLCALLSPKDLNIYIFDPKAGTSDFKAFTLPHVKHFASKYTSDTGKVQNSTYKGILEGLSWIVNTEAPRRKELIGNHKCVNINDFRRKYPDIELPYLYVVIDEMVTLSGMEKEAKSEYMSYLDTIVTQFPNLGIRGFFIAHEIKNQIISKTAYDAIKSRICVNGNADAVEASTGAKPKDFKYKLTSTGDMAIYMDAVSRVAKFVHGVALTDSNESNNALFDYMRRLWNKIDPDSGDAELAQSREDEVFMDSLIENTSADTLTGVPVEDVFSVTEDASNVDNQFNTDAHLVGL